MSKKPIGREVEHTIDPKTEYFGLLPNSDDGGYEADSSDKSDEEDMHASKRHKNYQKRFAATAVLKFEDDSDLSKMVATESEIPQRYLQLLLPNPEGFISSTGFHPPKYIVPLVALTESNNED